MPNISTCGRSSIRHSARAAKLTRCALPLVLFFPLPLTAGCTRTSDGSIEMVEPHMPDMMRKPWWGRGAAEPAMQPASVYPSGPALAPPPEQPRQPAARSAAQPKSEAGRAAQKFQGMRVGVRPPFTPSETGGALDCANQTEPGGRVRVVCE